MNIVINNLNIHGNFEITYQVMVVKYGLEKVLVGYMNQLMIIISIVVIGLVDINDGDKECFPWPHRRHLSLKNKIHNKLKNLINGWLQILIINVLSFLIQKKKRKRKPTATTIKIAYY